MHQGFNAHCGKSMLSTMSENFQRSFARLEVEVRELKDLVRTTACPTANSEPAERGQLKHRALLASSPPPLPPHVPAPLPTVLPGIPPMGPPMCSRQKHL